MLDYKYIFTLQVSQINYYSYYDTFKNSKKPERSNNRFNSSIKKLVYAEKKENKNICAVKLSKMCFKEASAKKDMEFN